MDRLEIYKQCDILETTLNTLLSNFEKEFNVTIQEVKLSSYAPFKIEVWWLHNTTTKTNLPKCN